MPEKFRVFFFHIHEIYEIPAMFQGINHGSLFVPSRLVFLVEMGLGGKVLQHFVPLAVPRIGEGHDKWLVSIGEFLGIFPQQRELM